MKDQAKRLFRTIYMGGNADLDVLIVCHCYLESDHSKNKIDGTIKVNDIVLFMASGGSDRDVEYALSKLLQMGTMAEYKSEFVVLANRVTGISESLLTSFYISELKLTLQIDLLRARPITLGEASALARITKARFEDERATTFISKPNDLNIAVQVQDIEETTLHTSDKVEVVSTSMVTTYEEHGCQDGFCMVATYEEQGSQDGLKPVTTKTPTRKKGDLGAITSKGGLSDHI
ncbi:hypothetical protein Tco_1473837 [Tanacetum coccineum]